MSVDFLSMILLGGIQTVMGPVVGAAASTRQGLLHAADRPLALFLGAVDHRAGAGLPARARRRLARCAAEAPA
jgi:hypothetical protein